MSAHPPPIPPDQRSDKADGAAPAAAKAGAGNAPASKDRNLAQQGRQANTKQNTTNKGFQQDR